MTNEEARIIVGNLPINGDECYSISEYQQAKAKAIKALETVERIKAQKQVTGRWIRKSDVYRGGYVECSVCGTPYKCIDPKKMKTCMVCHARMEAESE